MKPNLFALAKSEYFIYGHWSGIYFIVVLWANSWKSPPAPAKKMVYVFPICSAVS